MAETLSEGEVSSTSKDFLRIRYCKVVCIQKACTLKRIVFWSLRL